MLAALQSPWPPPLSQPLHSYMPPLRSLVKCALTKRGQRFLTTMATTTSRDLASLDRMLSKFVASSPKSVVLNTLSHVLSADSTHPYLASIALPLYTRVTKAPWFSWNSKLIADIVASLYKQERVKEAEDLISETLSSLRSKERDTVSFYCNLIGSLAKLGSETGFSGTVSNLKHILYETSSIYVRKRAYESLVSGLCLMGRPFEAETLINETRDLGVDPSIREWRSLVEGFGRAGCFEEMKRVPIEMQNDGVLLDTVCYNMVLSSYGMHNDLCNAFLWLQKMKSSGIGFSIRTYNSVLNSCPTITSILRDFQMPILIDGLLGMLTADEVLLVRELMSSSVLDEMIRWDSIEAKLDLHGTNRNVAYVIMLQWMDEVRLRLKSEKYEIPSEVVVVCGRGEHSRVRGDAPVKEVVREVMRRSRSPMKIDRKNGGCFVAKGKVVKEWLC